MRPILRLIGACFFAIAALLGFELRSSTRPESTWTCRSYPISINLLCELPIVNNIMFEL